MSNVERGRSERLRNHQIFHLLICSCSYQFAIYCLLMYLLFLRSCMHRDSKVVKFSLSCPSQIHFVRWQANIRVSQ